MNFERTFDYANQRSSLGLHNFHRLFRRYSLEIFEFFNSYHQQDKFQKVFIVCVKVGQTSCSSVVDDQSTRPTGMLFQIPSLTLENIQVELHCIVQFTKWHLFKFTDGQNLVIRPTSFSFLLLGYQFFFFFFQNRPRLFRLPVIARFCYSRPISDSIQKRVDKEVCKQNYHGQLAYGFF